MPNDRHRWLAAVSAGTMAAVRQPAEAPEPIIILNRLSRGAIQSKGIVEIIYTRAYYRHKNIRS